MVLHSSGHPYLTGPGPGHCAQLSEVMPEAWGWGPQDLVWDVSQGVPHCLLGQDELEKTLGLAFLFTCVTQPSSCRAQQLLEVQEKYLISSRHRSPRSNVSREDGQGEASATEGGASLRREEGDLRDHN